MVPKEIQSEVPSEDNEEGGKCPQSCSTHTNSLSSRVRQGLSEYNPFIQIQKYQSETVGRLTEQCRMRCQESVDNTWLSTSFTVCSLPAQSQKSLRAEAKSIWLSLNMNCKQRGGI